MAAKWCVLYCCWCSNAEDITDGMGGCDYNCNGCEYAENVGK